MESLVERYKETFDKFSKKNPLSPYNSVQFSEKKTYVDYSRCFIENLFTC